MRYLSPLGSRLSQGQGLLRIDWSNPLTRGLRLLMPIRHRGDVVNLVTGQKGTASSSLGSTAGRFGRGALFGSSAYLDFQDPGGITSGTQPITIAWRQEPRAPSSYSTILNWKPSGATNAFLIYQAADSAYHFACGPRASTSVPFFAMGAPVNEQVDTYVLVIAGGTDSTTASNYTLFRNGVRHTNSSTSPFGSSTTASARIGALDSGSDVFEGLISDFCIYSRALSDSEARTLSNNISQLYEPERRIWVPVEVGSGGQNLSPSLFTASASIYAPSISVGPVSLAPPLLTNSQTFYGPTVSNAASPQNLAPSLFSASAVLYAPTASVGGVSLAPPLLTNGQTFYAPTVTLGTPVLRPPLLNAAAVIYAPSVSGGAVVIRAKGLRKTRYVPSRVPTRLEEIPRYLQGEAERVNDALESPFTHQLLEKLHVEPGRLRDGFVAYADGSDWDPGSGEGVYVFYGASWHKLG